MSIYRQNATLPFGSIVITLTTSALTTYILEKWTPKAPVERIERKDNLSQPNGFVQITQARTAQVTAQLASTSTPVPVSGDEFVVDGVTYVVGEVEAAKEQGAMWKCNFDVREKV